MEASSNLAVEIRPLTVDELGMVERHLGHDWGNSQKHQKGLERQQRDELVYFIAWAGGLLALGDCPPIPVMRVLPVALNVRDCPDVMDLFVHPDQRSKGVGTQLLDKAHELARRMGYTSIGLGVGVDNHRARALYERLGYSDAGVDEYVDRWQYTDRDGRRWWEHQTCTYLVRSLR